MKRKRITFDISGKIYETYEDTLENFPDTLLGDELRRKEYLDPSFVTKFWRSFWPLQIFSTNFNNNSSRLI